MEPGGGLYIRLCSAYANLNPGLVRANAKGGEGGAKRRHARNNAFTKTFTERTLTACKLDCRTAVDIVNFTMSVIASVCVSACLFRNALLLSCWYNHPHLISYLLTSSPSASLASASLPATDSQLPSALHVAVSTRTLYTWAPAEFFEGGAPRGGFRKNILGGWPLIIWEATTTKRNYYRTNYIKHVEKLGLNYPEKNLKGPG